MFRGVGTALVTPFKSDGALDEAALEHERGRLQQALESLEGQAQRLLA